MGEDVIDLLVDFKCVKSKEDDFENFEYDDYTEEELI